MKLGHLLSAVGLVVSIQVATFGYVLKAESRLTRVETILERIAPPPRSSAPPPGGENRRAI